MFHLYNAGEKGSYFQQHCVSMFYHMENLDPCYYLPPEFEGMRPDIMIGDSDDPEKFVVIECKYGGGRLTPLQFDRYRKLNNYDSFDVYLMYGEGGRPNDPAAVYLIPFCFVNATKITTPESFKLPKKHHTFYTVQQIRDYSQPHISNVVFDDESYRPADLKRSRNFWNSPKDND